MSAPRARLVVFDLDGTLVDSSRDLATAVNRALARVAPEAPVLPEETVRSFVGSGARVLVTRSLDRAGLRHAVEDVLPVFLDAYSACLLDTTRLYPGTLDALDRLRESRLAVLTNKPGDMSRTILEGLGVAHFFFRVYGGGDLPTRKPDPAGLERLAAEAGVTPGEVVMVGDSAIDVRTGRAAGARTAGVTYGFDAGSFALDPPDILVNDMGELADRLAAQAPPRV
ncbi:MAG TPA: HAD-IA family hydrolase [Vicinamibacteria bacterium]|nr:HAD-IA family hydrolase [Vicinamibacteria bacterium]